jgi:RNase adaptor protein for sRNA GlmZ degradation
MNGTITANEAASLIQRLAEALAEGRKHIPIVIEETGGSHNVWVGDRLAATIREEASNV